MGTTQGQESLSNLPKVTQLFSTEAWFACSILVSACILPNIARPLCLPLRLPQRHV
jgi:hypothetical protein